MHARLVHLWLERWLTNEFVIERPMGIIPESYMLLCVKHMQRWYKMLRHVNVHVRSHV